MKFKAFVVLIGWVSLDPSPVTAKGLLKPGLQKAATIQKQDDPFENFAAEPEVSSALVVTSNTSEKQDVDYTGTALVSSDTSGMDCSDMKNHAAAITGIAAGGATLLALAFPPATGALCFWSLVAGVSTAGNGAVNYIGCDDDFKTDWKRVQKMAEEVYKTQSAKDLVGEIEANMRDKSDKIFFNEPASELDNLIDDFETLVRKYIVKDIGYESADLLLTVFGFVCDLYMLSLMKSRGVTPAPSPEKQGDPNPESSIEGQRRSCKSRFDEFERFVKNVKEYMNTLLWTNARRKFLSSVGCDEETVRNNLVCKRKNRYDDYSCEEKKWKCKSEFGGKSYSDDIHGKKWFVCENNLNSKCNDPRPPKLPNDEGQESQYYLVDKVFKPKYQKWYDSVHKKWESLNEISGTLNKIDYTIALKDICGKFEKPYCFPRFIPSKNQLSNCCDIEAEFKCGQFEGVCHKGLDTNGGARNAECKKDYKCVSVKSIISGTEATQEEKDYLVDRTKWDPDDTRTVCFKPGGPLPDYEDKDIPEFNRFFNDPCNDSAQCGKDLVCMDNECKELSETPDYARMRDSSGIGGEGYACIDNSDCAGTGHICAKGTKQCRLHGESIPAPTAKAAGASCDESTDCDVGHCCHNDKKTCVRNSKDVCMTNSLIGDTVRENKCGDSSDCKFKDACCADKGGCWGALDVMGRGDQCLPDPLRGGYAGIQCYDSSDCEDGACCAVPGGCWGIVGVTDNGDKCRRDPTGGGLNDIYECDSNSDCQSGNCNGGICGTGGGGATCVDSSNCEDGACCAVPGGCWGIVGVTDNGDKCRRDPTGGGLNDIYECDSNSDCQSNKCVGGICRKNGGGYEGASCVDTSDCADNNCCYDSNNECWSIGGVNVNGRMCLRDPSGGGLSGTYRCVLNSDCVSGKCEDGFCGRGNGRSGATCVDSSECAVDNCCAVPGGCWSVEGVTVRNGDMCRRDPNGGGLDGKYECDSHSDCKWGYCNRGICGGGIGGASCVDSSECAVDHCCYDDARGGCWNIQGVDDVDGRMCLPDSLRRGKNDIYKCTFDSDCESKNCEGGVCRIRKCTLNKDCPRWSLCYGGVCEQSGPYSKKQSSHDESTSTSPTESPCCGNEENLISKILHAKSGEGGGEHTMGLKTVIQKILM